MTLTRRFTLLLLTLGLTAISCTKPAEKVPEAAPTPAPATTPAPQDAAAMAHSDHSPKHGGVFFMAANNFHHLEGTYAEAGLFRLYLYDDHTQPLSVEGSSAHVRLAREPETTRHDLVAEPDGTSLAVRLDPIPELPVSLVLTLNVKDPKTGLSADHRFDFHFKTVGEVPLVPGETHSHTSPHGGQVVSVGDYHFELGMMGEVFSLWILDAQLGTLPLTSMEASLTVQRPDGSTQDVAMSAMGNHFMALSPVGNRGGATVLAQVSMDGRARIGRFTLPAAGDPAVEQH